MRAFIHSCFFFGSIMLLTFVAGAQTAPDQGAILAAAGNSTPVRDERYRIGSQDQLEIQVFRHPELTQRVNVNTNGTINLFRLKDPIIAVCKTE